MPSEHWRLTQLIGIQSNVVMVHAVGRVQAHHAMRSNPSAFNDFLQHLLRVIENFLCFNTHHLIFQNGGVRSGQIPSLKEWAPVDVASQFGQIKVLEQTAANELGRG